MDSSLVFRSKRETHLMRHPNFLYIIHYICATMKHFTILSIMALALILFTGCGVKSTNTDTAVLDDETGTLTLRGNVSKAQVQAFKMNSSVKSVVAAEGTVLPEDC